MRVTDPALLAAMFLHAHPGWSPADLERADPDVVDLIEDIAEATSRASKRED